MIQAEVEVGGALGVNHPAPDHCFALRLDDELALRLTERHHALELYRLVAADRDHLRRWIPWTATATPEWVAELVADELARFGSGQGWRAELCFRGRPIGLMWLHEWGGAGGSTEVGYLVARAYEGKGLVTRALRALVRHFFVERGVGRVAVGLDARNERSLAVVQRLGLRPEAVLRRVIAVDGEPADLSIFGLLREEYAPPPEDGPRVRRPPRFALRAAADDDVYVGLLERDDRRSDQILWRDARVRVALVSASFANGPLKVAGELVEGLRESVRQDSQFAEDPVEVAHALPTGRIGRRGSEGEPVHSTHCFGGDLRSQSLDVGLRPDFFPGLARFIV